MAKTVRRGTIPNNAEMIYIFSMPQAALRGMLEYRTLLPRLDPGYTSRWLACTRNLQILYYYVCLRSTRGLRKVLRATA